MSAGTERRAQIDQALEHRSIDLDGPMSRYQLKELIRVVEMLGGRLSYAAVGSPTAATYDTDADQGADAAIIFTAGAAAPGAAGNNILVAYADGATAEAETVTWTVDADGLITCTIGIDSGVSIAEDVIAALVADAGTLLTAALKTGNDGSGVVVADAATALTGGVDADAAGFTITPAA